jgi:hypothetical protein
VTVFSHREHPQFLRSSLVPEAAGFHLFVERPLTLGTGEDVLLLDDPPIDLIPAFPSVVCFPDSEGGRLRMAHGVLQGRTDSDVSSLIAARCT